MDTGVFVRFVQCSFDNALPHTSGYFHLKYILISFKLYYEKQRSKIDVDGTMFMLSVGMLLVEYFEPQYKHFGMKIFLCLSTVGVCYLLTCTSPSIDSINLVSVNFRMPKH